MPKDSLRYIDLFAGIGGFRLGFEKASRDLGIEPECVFTSEIKESAISSYSHNFEVIQAIDITKFPENDIPDFDVLLAGFPCQAFSYAGKRGGFLDTRGTLFFDIERILKAKRPKAFILENVEGLVKHDSISKFLPIGRTLEIILTNLSSLGYKVTWNVLDASNFGLAQIRNRIFIVGSLDDSVQIDRFPNMSAQLGDILESGISGLETKTTKLLLEHYSPEELIGKSLKDKRGGKNNIHSWDIELKGKTNEIQRQILNELLKARRNKKWAEIKGMNWMDGVPLTCDEIATFIQVPNLKDELEDLVEKGYLQFEHPKDFDEGDPTKKRMPRLDLPPGYNIVSGKLSFEVSKFLGPSSLAPTIVAMDVDKLAVVYEGHIRRFTVRELLRLFGFPEKYELVTRNFRDACDLLGNSIAVNVVTSVSRRLIESTFKDQIQK